MRRAMIVIGLASLALCSCTFQHYDRPCCQQPPQTCSFKSVKGLNHANAVLMIQGYGFTQHPTCHDNSANPIHDATTLAVLPLYKDWIVDVEPPAGNYACGTVLDLTFVSPKK